MKTCLAILAWFSKEFSKKVATPLPGRRGKPAGLPHLFRKFLLRTSIAVILLAGCSTPRVPQRYGWVTGLKPEKAEYYRELHAHPWPGVLKQIKACHIQNFSIREREIDGRLYLFAYLEYTGSDFEADMKRMASDPETQHWWKETDPCQSPLPDAAAAGKIWADTKEIFYLR